MLRIATKNCILPLVLLFGCGDKSVEPQDTGSANGGGTDADVSSDDDGDSDADEDADGTPADDTGVEVLPCRNLTVSPPSVLLDSTDGTLVNQLVTLTNDCLEEGEPLTINNVILADETGAFSVSAAPPYTLDSGMSTTIELTFQPVDNETRTAFAIIVSDDPDRPNSSIGIVGRPPADQDGDGFLTTLVGGEDCNDTDASIYPGAEETWYDGIDSNCDEMSDFDADLDGFLSTETEGGDDCDDSDPDVHPGTEDIWYDGIDTDCAGNDDYDQDGDGYASAAYEGLDCNDFDVTFSPDATEIWYDGIDTDCDGLSDYDADKDGHAHLDWGGDDCDDTDATMSPSAPEVADDGIDQDCSGIADDGTTTSDDDGDGYTEEEGDCDDAEPSVNPEGAEVCGDGLDNDCDGTVDGPVAVDCIDWYIDFDGDGTGDVDIEPICRCTAEGEYTVSVGGDCNDRDDEIYPGAEDEWYDTWDSNCDGLSDFDADGDGHNHSSWGGGDCDDTDPTIHPDAVEVYYDGIDSNCDGLSDFDADGDGHLHLDHGGDDCNDDDPLTSPTATDTMDLTDQDCDGFVDEDLIHPGDVLVSEVMATPFETADWNGEYFEIQNTTINPIDLLGWIITDADGDSFTIDSSLIIEPDGYLVFGINGNPDENGGIDVDHVYTETEFSLHYSADRILLTLEGTTIGSVDYTPSWGLVAGRALSLDIDFADPDYTDMSQVWCPSISTFSSGDHGTPGEANDPCLEIDWDGDSYTELMGDCDDFSTLASPGVEEACDEIDNDCDGYIDEGGAVGAQYWYADADDDTYGHLSSSVFSCAPPDNFVSDNSDCDDLRSDINPSIEEVWYDGIDSDCDGWSDFDSDFDDYDSTAYGGEDCDDEDATINPLIIDDWYDGIDSDCGGEDDYDADLDGYASDLYGGLDCADHEPGINPATPEYWNATDDNCLGGMDDFMVMGFSSLVITATEEINLGASSGISSGDMDGDDVTDLVIAADNGGYDAEGRAWVINGAEPWTLVGAPYAASTAQFSGAAAENYMGTLGAHQEDHIGSARADLLVAGTDELGGYAMCLIDGDQLDGAVNCSDGAARWTGANGAFVRIINHLDIDGDGLPEVIYADAWEGIGSTGMVYTFNGSSVVEGDFSLTGDLDWRIDGRHAYDYVGSQVGGGDLNNDGYDDLMIGANGDDHPDSKTGSIFIFHGGPDAPPTIRTAQFDKDIHIFGSEMNAEVGSKTPGEVGDVNGDGASDLIVSSPGTESVHIFYSSADLGGGSHNASSADVSVFGTTESDNFGAGLAVSDLDSDGFDDVIIGAPDEDSPGLGTADTPGHAYLFFGAEIVDSLLYASDAGAHFYGRTTGDNFGAVIRSDFDMNDDGRSDLAIAAPGNTLSTPGAGQVHILLMPAGR